MHQSENNFRTLWKLMEGHRRRYFNALLAMFFGVGLLYITPLITRAAIDGVIDTHPTSNISWAARFLANHRQTWGIGWSLVLVAAAMVGITASAAAFMNLQGRWSGIASETI